jgi:hypothetical protein
MWPVAQTPDRLAGHQPVTDGVEMLHVRGRFAGAVDRRVQFSTQLLTLPDARMMTLDRLGQSAATVRTNHR